MAKSFVSVFKLDGVPILPPMINDEVRAGVAIYRQKAIEIEKTIQARKEAASRNLTTPSGAAMECSVRSPKERLTFNVEDYSESHGGTQANELSSTETVSVVQQITNGESEELPVPIDVPELHQSRTLTPTKVETISPIISPATDSSISRPASSEQGYTGNVFEATTSQMVTTATPTSKTDLPIWQTSTRTVTPTSDESLPWLPLVRSNTYNLEKPTIDLQNLQLTEHSTPIEAAKSGPGNEIKQPVNQRHGQQKRLFVANGTAKPTAKAIVPTHTHCKRTEMPNKVAPKHTQTPEKLKQALPACGKARPKRNLPSRTISVCSAGSGKGASERTSENATQVLTAHEQRMRELLNRQEEERLLLEKSFREKTQELVSLCAKSLSSERNGTMVSNAPAACTKRPELDPASSVSQLSLCELSYDSCTDTDDAAYQTCHANGTSEENATGSEHRLNSSLAKPPRDRDLITERGCSPTIFRTNDAQFTVLPQRMKELQQHRAATIINAYAKGYLVRRLLRTDEVQSIKRTIVDIVCFIMESRSQKNRKVADATDGSVRRSAGKHIAFCLDRLHDIFINYSPAQRLQMIRRDRYLKSKGAQC